MALINNGSAPAYPIITFNGPGRIYNMKNPRTFDTINFDYVLQTGEEAILDLRPDKKTFWSKHSGNLLSLGAILSGSDVTTFRLLPGENPVSTFIDDATATVSFYWETRFISFDG